MPWLRLVVTATSMQQTAPSAWVVVRSGSVLTACPPFRIDPIASPWSAVPPRWRVVDLAWGPARSRRQGPGGPSSAPRVGRTAPCTTSAAGHGGPERVNLSWRGRPIRYRPGRRSGPGLHGAAVIASRLPLPRPHSGAANLLPPTQSAAVTVCYESQIGPNAGIPRCSRPWMTSQVSFLFEMQITASAPEVM